MLDEKGKRETEGRPKRKGNHIQAVVAVAVAKAMTSTISSLTSRPSTTSPGTNTGVKLGTVLSPGQVAVYPSSLFTPVPQNHTSHGLSKGAIAGIAVGAAAGGLLIFALVFLLLARRRRNRRSQRDSAAHLLPPQASGGRPDMVQNYAGTANLALPPPLVAAGGGHGYASAPTQQKKPFMRPGRSFRGAFESGHQRGHSASSTTAFLPGTDSAAFSSDNPRLSHESSINTTPAMSFNNRFRST